MYSSISSLFSLKTSLILLPLDLFCFLQICCSSFYAISPCLEIDKCNNLQKKQSDITEKTKWHVKSLHTSIMCVMIILLLVVTSLVFVHASLYLFFLICIVYSKCRKMISLWNLQQGFSIVGRIRTLQAQLAMQVSTLTLELVSHFFSHNDFPSVNRYSLSDT